MPLSPKELMKLTKVGLLLWFVMFTIIGFLTSYFIFNSPLTPMALFGAMIVPFSVVIYSQYKVEGSVKLTS